MTATIHEMFPTKVMTIDNARLKLDVDKMLTDIHNYIETRMDLIRSPYYQSEAMIFDESYPHFDNNWQILKDNFIEQAWKYLHLCRDEIAGHDEYDTCKVTGWFYQKDMKNLRDSYANNPMHNHHPAQVVGVYYLNNPGYEGTTLYNPCQFKNSKVQNRTLSGPEGGWTIFPGWMQHTSSGGAMMNTLERTVIACNAYFI